LQIHHIVHWADGGETCIENGVSLCQHNHQLIHSGEFTIERATVVTPESENALTQGLFSSSKRRLLPSRCRFRVKQKRKHQRNHQQTNDQVERPCEHETSSCSVNYANNPHPENLYSQNLHTQQVNECRNGDLRWVKNSCNTSTGSTTSNICTATYDSTTLNTGAALNISVASFDQIMKNVHSSHTLHVEGVGHGSHLLPVPDSTSSAACHSAQLPP
jgi:hypothetical protein